MIIKKLRVANLRAFSKTTEFNFQPGMNLLVGANGVGKSTVLDAIRILLSKMLPDISDCKKYNLQIKDKDITVGSDFATLELLCSLEDRILGYFINQPRDRSHNFGQFSGWTEPPGKNSYHGKNGQPYALYFSPSRSVIDEKKSTLSTSPVETAFKYALKPRQLKTQELEKWLQEREALTALDEPIWQTQWDILCDAVSSFLEMNCEISAGGLKKNGITLNLNQLSDGELGSLALVLELTKRLTAVNPELSNPARESEAIVLIDEIDLHLHPKWQRSIINKLIKTFPKCQFIATTHSPQVIGEVAHDRIQIITPDEVYSPGHSYGVDSSRVLEEIMNTESRNADIKDLLSLLSQKIEDNDFTESRHLIEKLGQKIGQNDPEVIRNRTIIDFLEE